MSHKGIIPVDPTFQAADNSRSGNQQSTKASVVRLHKAGKLFNPTATDTESGSESSQSNTGARQSVVRQQKGFNPVSPTF